MLGACSHGIYISVVGMINESVETLWSDQDFEETAWGRGLLVGKLGVWSGV